MPLIKKLKSKSGDSKPEPAFKRASTKTKVELTLPDGPEDPISDISEATFLIYGENKIGKTSLCSQFEDPIFLMFEPGGKGLRIARRQCNSWTEFTGYIDLIVKSDRYKTVVIDPINLCYKACVDHICKREAVDDPADVGWGKGWKAIEDEFVKQVRRISTTHRGVVFLGHPEQAEFEKRTGGKYNKIVPRMMKQARNFVEAFVDVIAFYGYYGDYRMLTIEGSDELDAGNRLKYKFRTTSGERIHSIPMFDDNDSSFDEERAYENLIAAFNNEQEDRWEPEDKLALSDAPAQRERKRR